jgi:hypothetical protein
VTEALFPGRFDRRASDLGPSPEMGLKLIVVD